MSGSLTRNDHHRADLIKALKKCQANGGDACPICCPKWEIADYDGSSLQTEESTPDVVTESLRALAMALSDALEHTTSKYFTIEFNALFPLDAVHLAHIPNLDILSLEVKHL